MTEHCCDERDALLRAVAAAKQTIQERDQRIKFLEDVIKAMIQPKKQDQDDAK